MQREKDNTTLGWGAVTREGAEMWDSNPVFTGEQVGRKDWVKLLLYPKKLLLYWWIKRNKEPSTSAGRQGTRNKKTEKERYRILDVGCGTGATLIDFKKLFGRGVDVAGVDVVQLQIDVAEKKMRSHGVWAQILCYDGAHLPFPDASFDAVYTSDVLGHVRHVPEWLSELARVLRPGGALAMFAESKLGRHAWIRKYLFDRGLNVDPHAAFHISLYSKQELRAMIEHAGFRVNTMNSILWAAFFIHPDEFYETLQSAAPRFPVLRFVNRILYRVKKKLHPYSTAAGELYGVLEMLLVGRWNEAQGYIVLAKKKN